MKNENFRSQEEAGREPGVAGTRAQVVGRREGQAPGGEGEAQVQAALALGRQAQGLQRGCATQKGSR